MDAPCRFGLDYRPGKEEPDPVLELHLQNCEDCQGQIFVVE
jgi:hypothetical protein